MQPKVPLADCPNCPLQHRPFCGSTIPANATHIVIGDAPGIDEIIEKKAFIGQSGIVLRQALEYSGVNPDNVAMTNAVLCRPFNDTSTPDAAIVACAERLDNDIRQSGAQHLIAAGNTAARALDLISGQTINGGVLARAGHTYRYDNFRHYTVTTNPAYVLRQDPYTPTYLRHMQLAVNPIERNFDVNAVKIAVMNESNVSTSIQYLNRFDRGTPCAFDVETGGLQWYDTPDQPASPLLCVVITLEDWRSVIIPAYWLRTRAVRDALLMCLNEYHIIAHNGKFDQNVMHARESIDFELSDDTMLMHYVLYELGVHGLKPLSAEYLGTPDYEKPLIDWFAANGMANEKNRDYAQLPTDILYQYAGIDGAVTLQLWRLFDVELRAKGLYEWPYKNVLLETGNALPTIEQTGIPIDRNQLARARVDFEGTLTTIEETMSTMLQPLIEGNTDPTLDNLRRLMSKRRLVYAGDDNGKGGRKRSTQRYETYFEYNPRSNDQTSAIIYQVLKLKLTKRLMKETASNTGKEALEALPPHAFITDLRQHRRLAKMLDTYISSIERRATPDDIIHVDFRLTGTEIGRLSASNGDHGIPRPDDYYGAVIRSAFIADPATDALAYDDQEVLVIADYSQAELRAFAHLAGVKFLIDKYNAGQDVHTETALMLEQLGAELFKGFKEAMITSKNVHNFFSADTVARAKAFMKRLRVLAKNINFGNIYQGGAAGIAGMIGNAVPASVIRDILTVYHEIMPEAGTYAQSQFAYLQAHGYVKTVFNRHRRFYIISDFNKDEAEKAVVHMVVAGSAADCTNLSAARLVRQGVRVCHSVHDSLIARAKRREARQVADLMTTIMQGVGNEFMPSVPWVADIECNEDGSFPRRWVPAPNRADFDARGKLIV